MKTWIPKLMGDTRRQREAKVLHTFGPLYKLVADLRAGFVDAIKGEPVLIAWGEYMSVAHTLTGFAGCFARIAPEADLSIFGKVAKKLANGVPITEAEVDALDESLKEIEAIYRRTPLADLKAAILTEQVAIELEIAGVTA